MTTRSDAANGYLAELTLALRILPKDIRREIHSGVVEELDGLDVEASARRISELGDPRYIAAAALAELDSGEAIHVDPPSRANDKTWYTLTTVFALLLGGIVIPFVGWFGGVVLLWASKTWTLLDKIVGTLILPFGLVISLSVATMMYTYYAGSPQFWVLACAVVALPIGSAVYLLIRARLLKRQ